jgi:hypothetical protein
MEGRKGAQERERALAGTGHGGPPTWIRAWYGNIRMGWVGSSYCIIPQIDGAVDRYLTTCVGTYQVPRWWVGSLDRYVRYIGKNMST